LATTPITPMPPPVQTAMYNKDGSLAIAWVSFFSNLSALASQAVATAGPPGPAGAAGAAGAAGRPGPPGPPGRFAYITAPVVGGAATIAITGPLCVFEVQLTSGSTVTIGAPSGGSVGDFFYITQKQDSTGNGTGAFASSGYSGVSDQIWTDATPNVKWSAPFIIRPDGIAMLIGPPYAGETY